MPIARAQARAGCVRACGCRSGSRRRSAAAASRAARASSTCRRRSGRAGRGSCRGARLKGNAGERAAAAEMAGDVVDRQRRSKSMVTCDQRRCASRGDALAASVRAGLVQLAVDLFELRDEPLLARGVLRRLASCRCEPLLDLRELAEQRSRRATRRCARFARPVGARQRQPEPERARSRRRGRARRCAASVLCTGSPGPAPSACRPPEAPGRWPAGTSCRRLP